PVRGETALREDLIRVLAPERGRVADAWRHAGELDGSAHHGNLAELGMRHLLHDATFHRLRIAHHLVHGVHGGGGNVRLREELEERLPPPPAPPARWGPLR